MSKTHSTVMTHLDTRRLKSLIRELSSRQQGMQEHVTTLEEMIDLARIVSSENVSADVVTMNSKVTFQELDGGSLRTITVVYPADAKPSDGKISILSPIGRALLGASIGAEVDVQMPYDQEVRIRVIQIGYQPEAEGCYTI